MLVGCSQVLDISLVRSIVVSNSVGHKGDGILTQGEMTGMKGFLMVGF